MRKSLSFLLLLVFVLSLGASTLSSCARRTAQQKKTSWYKKHGRGKAEPCPCDR
jgi:hypothetical protein